jgi:hypothetical protein
MYCRSITNLVRVHGRTSSLTAATLGLRRQPVGCPVPSLRTARLMCNKPDKNVSPPDEHPEADDLDVGNQEMIHFGYYLLYLIVFSVSFLSMCYAMNDFKVRDALSRK